MLYYFWDCGWNVSTGIVCSKNPYLHIHIVPSSYDCLLFVEQWMVEEYLGHYFQCVDSEWGLVLPKSKMTKCITKSPYNSKTLHFRFCGILQKLCAEIIPKVVSTLARVHEEAMKSWIIALNCSSELNLFNELVNLVYKTGLDYLFTNQVPATIGIELIQKDYIFLMEFKSVTFSVTNVMLYLAWMHYI